jgi:acyl-CoA synthetase (AMP-forming)/AMP-acid ligase II
VVDRLKDMIITGGGTSTLGRWKRPCTPIARSRNALFWDLSTVAALPKSPAGKILKRKIKQDWLTKNPIPDPDL